jgi:hypothetical protein
MKLRFIAGPSFMALCILGASAVIVPAAQASTVTATFDFQSPAGLLGTTQSYTVSGLTITAAGFSGSNFSTPNAALFDKTLGGDENGLGLSGSDNEITAGSFVRIAIPTTNISAVSFTIGSSTAGEGWKVFGSNSPTGSLTFLLQGSSELTSNSLALYPYYFFTAARGDVLLQSFTLVDPPALTPLPAALPLFATGIGGLGLLGWRRKRKAQAL